VTASRGDEDGTVLVWLPALLVVAVLLGLATLEIGAHLVAIARAAALADAAALAAVSAQVDEPDVPPHQAAAEVVAAGEGRLEACDCSTGTARAEVTVSVAVPGIVRPRLGAERQTARATAVLTDTGVPARGSVP
jgi:hypothetical protein